MDGTETVVATTQAWGAQLGAQVQWGGSDKELLFNAMLSDIKAPDGAAKYSIKNDFDKFKEKQKGIAGLVVDPSTGTGRALECPVYHVSIDGHSTVSPHMMKIKHTQLGYGVDYARSSRGTAGYTDTEAEPDTVSRGPNKGAPDNDGVFVGSVVSGECKLVASLKDLARIAGINSASVPVYGFHTKWSSDNEYILFVMRSLEKKAGLAGILTKNAE